MLDILFFSLCGLCIGILIAFISEHVETRRLLQKVTEEGGIIVHEAKDKEELLVQKTMDAFNAYKEEFLLRFHQETSKKREQIQKAQSRIDKKIHHTKITSKQKLSLLNSMEGKIKHLKKLRKTLTEKQTKLQEEIQGYKDKLIQNLLSHFSLDAEEIKNTIAKNLETYLREVNFKKSQIQEEDLKQNLQDRAQRILNMALNRFQMPYCSERGISAIVFKNKKQMEKVIGPNRVHLNNLEKECGVDFVVHEEDSQASVYGIDPVRRELGRMSLNTLAKNRYINMKSIKEIVRKSKQKLFEKIEKDGKAICSRLHLNYVKSEVKNMLGTLRYRYSFAQNQHFHCEEVGWLCGLLSSELGITKEDGKRSGLFHDIGKAMDHAREGNHAVIGADFISQYGERDKVVHAVRAHHHDEPPSTSLAWLVISADAISGSRPGARRFTEDSYSKKLESMERIIDSFNNIEDAYIMNAGREMRVVVDHKKVSDEQALDLSKAIAKRIEKECSYPGLIKVTVVRPSVVTATAH